MDTNFWDDYSLRDNKHPYNQALYYACQNADLNLAKHLICCGANCHTIQNKNKETLLHAAIRNPYQDLTILEYLIKKLNIDVNKQDLNGQTPLIIACQYDFFEGVKFLVENKADVNIKDNGNISALAYSLVHSGTTLDDLGIGGRLGYSDFNIAKYLIKNNAEMIKINTDEYNLIVNLINQYKSIEKIQSKMNKFLNFIGSSNDKI